MKPKVSIVVPVYKVEHTLTQCVQSLLSQTLQDIEIVLVDDGSPDSCGAMCDSFAADARVRVVHKENGGLGSARNAGIAVASGEYIGFVDSDDYVSPEMFRKLYERIQRDGSDVCICSHYTVDDAGTLTEHHFSDVPFVLHHDEILRFLILPMIGPDPYVKEPFVEGFVWRNLYKRELLLEHPFRSEREYFAEDVVSDMEIYPCCEQISILDECLYYYRFNDESLSNRYRPGVHILLNNLLLFQTDFLKKEELFDAEQGRLYRTGFKFVVFSVRNVKKSGLGKREKKRLVREVLDQSELKTAVRRLDIRSYSFKARLYRRACLLRLAGPVMKI